MRLLWLASALAVLPSCAGETSANGPTDADRDGFSAGDDCDDHDAARHPDATEVCNDIDDDCDGHPDELAVDATPWYRDLDGDGFGDAAASVTDCAAPPDYVAVDGDCEDGTDGAGVHPGAVEVCNGVDDDCNGPADDAATDAAVWFHDADGDGHGDAAAPLDACTQPTEYVANDTDCDDGLSGAGVYPGAAEVCNGADDDCDGVSDDAPTDQATWYHDADSDGYGDAASSTVACAAPSQYVAAGTDCDDTSDAIHPQADEQCNDVDDDCDGETDENAIDADIWYADADLDGYGDAATALPACTQPSGYLLDATDCLDSDATVYPGALELCDEQRNDCANATWTDDDGIATLAHAAGFSDLSGTWVSGEPVKDLSLPITAGTLHLCAGYYQLRLNDNDGPVSLRIVGHGFPGLSAGGTGRVIDLASSTASELELDGVVVSNGAGDSDGGCVRTSASATLRVRGSRLMSCTSAGNGGAIFAAGPLVLEGSYLEASSAATAGGAVAVRNTASIVGTTMTDNAATDGGALHVATTAAVSVDSTTLSYNTASGAGGGVTHAGPGSLTWTGGTVEHNQAAVSAGGLMLRDAAVTLTDLLVYRNQLTGSAAAGGGISAVAVSPLALTRVVVSDNDAGVSATTSLGGGMAVTQGETVLSEVEISDNSAGMGGGVFFEGGGQTLTLAGGSLVSGNSVNGRGGGIYTTSTGVVYCGAGTAGSARIVGNLATIVDRGAGVWLETAAGGAPTFVARGCDFGANLSADDNRGGVTFSQDVTTPTATYGYGDNVSVDCGTTGCVVP